MLVGIDNERAVLSISLVGRFALTQVALLGSSVRRSRHRIRSFGDTLKQLSSKPCSNLALPYSVHKVASSERQGKLRGSAKSIHITLSTSSLHLSRETQHPVQYRPIAMKTADER
jgi:hypothetical protein